MTSLSAHASHRATAHAASWAHDLMATEDKDFFAALGQRIATLRKAQNMTQQQLAEQLGIAQQTLAHYEGARLRVPASMLPQLAQLFGVAVDALVGQPVAKERGKRGRVSALQQQFEQIEQLPKTKQKFVLEMLSAVLAKGSA
ncbi:MAG: helix-turn-helix transcriptional regulator [Brachymonas sp.]|nr:helix-turn-helix transcriptional regulator [Brachymonas sp.]